MPESVSTVESHCLSSCTFIADIFTAWLVCVWAIVLVCQDLMVVGMLVECFGDYMSASVSWFCVCVCLTTKLIMNANMGITD